MPSSASGSLALLVSALRSDTSPGDWSRQAQTVDAEKLAVSAIVLGIAPLVAHRLTDWSISLPARAQAKLLAARTAATARQQAIIAQLSEILAAAKLAKIDVIVLKGAHLAAHVYPEAGLRPMNDIDILVRPNQLAAMEELLCRLGYVGHYKDPERGARVVKHTSTFQRPNKNAAGTPNPYLSAESERTVEPHLSLEESWYGLRADMSSGVWERSITVNFDGQEARALCFSDLLLHLCIHLSFHLIMSYPSLVQLVDLMEVCPRLSQADWDSIGQRAVERRIAGYVYAALRLARSVLSAQVPDCALAELRAHTPSVLRAYADALTVDDVVLRAQRAPLTTIRQRLTRGVAERAEAARWATSLPERLAVWWTLIDVTRTDTGRMLGARLLGHRTSD